jgi:hypothetical protein
MAEKGFIDRLKTGIAYIIAGADVVPFGPMQPLQPVFQEGMEGRQFDYPVGFNLVYVPRQDTDVGFAMLRGLADGYDLMRLAIETRKDQLSKLEWSIVPIDPAKQAANDPRCQEVEDLFRFPDREHDFATWRRALHEDLLVIDAPTAYPRMTKGGKLYSLDLMDGALITRKLDGEGRTPMPPEVAYQQYIKGVPAVDYSADEIIYMPRNIRTNKAYGFSPVEQVIITVNIALRRQIHQLSYYTEGNLPDLIFGVPEDWNPDQIKQFQLWFDSLMSGDLGERRKAKFVPHGIEPYDIKQNAIKDEYDEWLARIICFAFSLPPTAFVKQMNRAQAQSEKDRAQEEGLEPIMVWEKNFWNKIIWKYFGYRDLQFKWQDVRVIDPLVQAEVDKIYLQEYVISPDEVRTRQGLVGAAPVKPLPPAMGQPTNSDAAPGGDNEDGGKKLPAKKKGNGDDAVAQVYRDAGKKKRYIL